MALKLLASRWNYLGVKNYRTNNVIARRCVQWKPYPCHFHSSPARCALPPLLLLALRPIMNFSAILFGRGIKKWWQKLPPDRKKRIVEQIRSRRFQIVAGCAVLNVVVCTFYVEHVEEDPITKRKRFILYNEQQMSAIADLEFAAQLAANKPRIVPPRHPIYRRVVRVANQILQANASLPQIKEKEWSVTVIDKPETANAFVLPNGKIILFTGILNVASNDDQLAVVLSHEISHTLLRHMAENLSKTFFVEMVLLIPLVLIWAVLPDVAALFSHWLSSRLAQIVIHLPFSRAVEKEADIFGLELAARACYDVREAPVFWGKMRQVNDDEPLEWLSTHPSNESRQVQLAHLIPAALQLRQSCHCPRLPRPSPSQLYHTRGLIKPY